MVMSLDQTAGLGKTMEGDNNSIEKMESSDIWEQR
jgi:hypothetical protein